MLLALLVPLGPDGAQAVVGHHFLEQLLGGRRGVTRLCCTPAQHPQCPPRFWMGSLVRAGARGAEEVGGCSGFVPCPLWAPSTQMMPAGRNWQESLLSPAHPNSRRQKWLTPAGARWHSHPRSRLRPGPCPEAHSCGCFQAEALSGVWCLLWPLAYIRGLISAEAGEASSADVRVEGGPWSWLHLGELPAPTEGAKPHPGFDNAR